MTNDHFDPQYIDEQIAQCLEDNSEQEEVAVRVVHDLQQEYLPGDHQEALQRVWQRINQQQVPLSSMGLDTQRSVLLREDYRKQRRNRPMPSSLFKRLAVLAAVAACILVVGSMLVVVSLYSSKRTLQTTHAGQSSPVTTSVYTHTEDSNHIALVLSWSPDSQRLFVKQQVTTVEQQATADRQQVNTTHQEVEAWDATTGQNYLKYQGDSANIWSSYNIDGSPNGKYIAYLSSPDFQPKGIADQIIHAKIVVIDASSAQVLHTSGLLPLGPNHAGIPEMSWSSDNTTISFVSQSNANELDIVSWNMITGQQITRPITNSSSVQAPGTSILSQYWSPDGKYIVLNTSVQGNVPLFIVDAQAAQFVGSYTFFSPLFYNPLLGWTADTGQFFFLSGQSPPASAGGQNSSVQMTSITPTGQVVSESTLSGVNSIVPFQGWLSPDGKYLALSKDTDHEVDIWSLANKKIVTKYQVVGEGPPAFSWSPDEHFVAIATGGYSYYTADGEKITTWKIALP